MKKVLMAAIIASTVSTSLNAEWWNTPNPWYPTLGASLYKSERNNPPDVSASPRVGNRQIIYDNNRRKTGSYIQQNTFGGYDIYNDKRSKIGTTR